MSQHREVLIGIGFLMSLAIGTVQAQSNANISTVLDKVAATNTTAAQSAQSRTLSYSDRMEQFKKNNPDQYAQMMKQREEYRLQLEQRTKERSDFLASVDTKNMSQEQRLNHTKLLAAIEQSNKIRAQLMEPNAGSRTDLSKELHDNTHSISELYALERRYLLEELARSSGYKGTNVVTFVNRVQSIIDNTATATGTTGFGGRGRSTTARTTEPASGK